MSGFIDFAEVKKSTSYEKTIQLLGLQLKQVNPSQWRGPCPTCDSGGDRALVVTEGRGAYCFAGKTGGDQIQLVAHIKGCSLREAAEFLTGTSSNRSTSSTVKRSTVPESDSRAEGPKKFTALTYLEHEHQAVDAVGFCSAFAKKLGIGFAPKGTMRGLVCVPIRDEAGELLGYIGITEAKLPASFTPNVVEFKKQA